MQPKTALEWTRRIDRAQELREDTPSAEQLLGFYEGVMRVQAEIAADLERSPTTYQANKAFREQIELNIPLRHLPSLLEITNQRGTKVLAEAAREYSNPDFARKKLLAFLQSDGTAGLSGADHFFSLSLLQPTAEYLARDFSTDTATVSRCSICDSLPQSAVLRPEGDGAKRMLQCSLCLTEWAYRRVLCPWCGETDREKLPRYTPDECNYVRVEACDTCKHYLKSVDMTINGRAVPMVDEVAFAALDVWALDQGFKKIALNLLGF